MLNFVCLSPHFPENFQMFWVRMQEAGARVLGIGDMPYDALPERLQRALTEYYRVDDMHLYPQLEGACQHFIEKYGPIYRLESHNEYWLETEARLRSVFQIAGQGSESIENIKSKSQMKLLYQAGGIPVARGQKVYHWEDSQNLIAQTGYPVVAKPDIGVGAADTFKLRNEDELRYFWEHKPSVDYFMEEFVAGTLYSFDGLVNRAGEIVFCASHRFSQGIMEIVNYDLELSYYSLREIPTALYEAGQKVIKTFGIKERFFHFEFFHLPDDRWVALEVNIRPPGGLTTDMFNYANDIDIYRGYAELMLHGEFPYTAQRPYHCAYAGRKHGRNYHQSHEALVRDLGSALVYTGPMSPIFYRVMGYQGYLIRSPDLNEIQAMIAYIQAAD